MARPTRYKAEYAVQAGKLCKLGAIDKDLADFFGVSEQTINTWKQKHKPFLESLKKGKGTADEQVKQALFQRACGYSHPDTVVKYDQDDQEFYEHPIMKHYPPDTAACFIWLKNRDPENWRDKKEVHANTPTAFNMYLHAPDDASDD